MNPAAIAAKPLQRMRIDGVTFICFSPLVNPGNKRQILAPGIAACMGSTRNSIQIKAVCQILCKIVGDRITWQASGFF
jgi:hypothetical protein